MVLQSEKTVITQELKTTNKPVANFVTTDFRDAIIKKGYNVIHERYIKCPCKSRNSEFLSSCKNCGGSGAIFLNPVRTRMIIQSMSLNPQYKEWGVYGAEMSSITALPEDKLSYMDKITVLGAISEHSEVLHPVKYNDVDTDLYAYTIYPIIDTYFVGLFVNTDSKLTKLELGTDFSIQDENKRKVIFNQAIFAGELNPSVTIRYSHNPAYYIENMVRDSMEVSINKGRFEQKVQMPIHAQAKRIDLFKDIENYNGDRLFDNSFKVCEPDKITN